ncbi:hypothetical protein EDB80DRAFT_678729 [Ilyonectria destructans]|nr:hypothetical protein EDB80DRAFT_678729 [Ilyonectria destructans]
MYKKHPTFDLWTSPQKHALRGVAIHSTDALKRPQTSLLALRRLCGPRCSEDISPTLRERLSEYEISADELGCFTCDKANANYSAVNEIIGALYITFSNRGCLGCSGRLGRWGCLGRAS